MTTTQEVAINNQIYHLAAMGSMTAYCGVELSHSRVLNHPRLRSHMNLCGNCDRTNARYTTDRIEPEIEGGATRRGGALADAGRVREVTGRIFRVAGSTDTYTIIIPSDRDLASTCTCMAAKTHPEIMCKHQSAVYLTIGGGE